MQKLIFDAGPLITACKFSAAGQGIIDHLLTHCEITIATSVQNEVTIAGKHYPDAQIAQQRIDEKKIAVLSPPAHPVLKTLLAPYKLGDGEQDTILLAEHVNMQNATLVIDDHLAYLVCDRLRQQKRFLLDIIVDLASSEKPDRELAMDITKAIQTRYPPAFMEHTMLLLRR